MTVKELATEINPTNPGQGVEDIIGFLGHLSGLTADSELDAQDVQDVRAQWAA